MLNLSPIAQGSWVIFDDICHFLFEPFSEFMGTIPAQDSPGVSGISSHNSRSRPWDLRGLEVHLLFTWQEIQLTDHTVHFLESFLDVFRNLAEKQHQDPGWPSHLRSSKLKFNPHDYDLSIMFRWSLKAASRTWSNTRITSTASRQSCRLVRWQRHTQSGRNDTNRQRKREPWKNAKRKPKQIKQMSCTDSENVCKTV